ncbi:MAG: hypothetical protein JJT95_13800 [Pararhodobacter sp.]|nr:hypothetical protein [Pararhodobacter sp.]
MQYFTTGIIAITMAIGVIVPLSAQADSPTQELRIVVPFSPGGLNGIIARNFCEGVEVKRDASRHSA